MPSVYDGRLKADALVEVLGEVGTCTKSALTVLGNHFEDAGVTQLHNP